MGIRSMLRKVFGRDREESPATSVPSQTRETPSPSPDTPEAAAQRKADELVAEAFDNPQIPKARTADDTADTADAAPVNTADAASVDVADAAPADAAAADAGDSVDVAAVEASEPETVDAEAVEAPEAVETVETVETEAVEAEVAADATSQAEATDAPVAATDTPTEAEAEAEAEAETQPEGAADAVTTADADAEPEGTTDEAEPEAAAADAAPETPAADEAEEPAEATASAVEELPEAEAAGTTEADANATEPAPEAEVEADAEPTPAEVTSDAEPTPAEPEVEAAPEEVTVDVAPEDVTAEAEDAPVEPEAEAQGAGGSEGPAVALGKVKAGAPQLAEAYKAAGAALKKEGLTGARAAVYLVVDRSGSMRGYFKDGSVQRLAEQTVALAAHLDEAATVTTVFFSTDIDGTVDLAPADLTPTRVEEVNGTLGRLGRTNYHRAVEEVLAHHEKADPTRPALVVFQTDGAPESKTAATQALAEAADRPLQWRFVVWGEEDNKAFDFLRKLDGTPRTGVYFAGATPVETAHAAFYRGLLTGLEF